MQKPRRSKPEPIQDSLRAFFRDHPLSRGSTNGEVFQAWQSALPPAYQGRATPVKFHNSVLTIEVDSSVLLQELKGFGGDRFRRKTNQNLGSETVRRITFKLRG